MTNLPPEIMPAVKILCRDVKKPEVFAHHSGIGKGHPEECFLRFQRFRGGKPWKCCIMGLHPRATTPAPVEEGEFPELDNVEIGAVARFWDQVPRKDAKEVVDLIWKEEGHEIQ